MSWSLAVIGGDLSLGGPGGFTTVQDSAKLLQDLRHWLLEPRGSDPSHPDYGSSLDGGILPDGSYENVGIGNSISDESLMNLEAEMRRILISYQQQQADRLTRETVSLQGRNTFGVSEILVSIENINLTQIDTTVIANIQLLTSSGDILTISQPLT